LWGQLTNYLPWVSLIAGFTGSAHCVSMCGGLVTFSTETKADIYRYQFGRLLAYLFLGLLAGLFSSLIHLEVGNPKLTLIPGLILGSLFLYWGIETLRGKRAEIPMPKFMTQIYSKLFGKLVTKNNKNYRSFFTGLLSIFLPCGVLYTVVLSVAAFETKWWALFSMFFFWLGTLPAMLLAPQIIKNILNPLRSKVPKIYATILIVIGIGTIGFRITRFQELNQKQAFERLNDKLNCH
jgi:sulfite exporter TauE/SafE